MVDMDGLFAMIPAGLMKRFRMKYVSRGYKRQRDAVRDAIEDWVRGV